jgi:hypothetical protein
MFNDCLARLSLCEIPRSGARFTWTNKQLDPVRSVLDRAFVSTNWKQCFPLSSLRAETQIGSDHTPLLLDTGEVSSRKSPRFFFETSWLDIQDIPNLVVEKWFALLQRPLRP